MSTGSGTITPITAGSGLTLATLRARCRLLLASTTDWPNATLDSWIADAIRAYSAEFPRALRYSLALTTGTQSYNLPAGCLAVTAVEYPAGEDPPEYLYLADEWYAGFQAGGEWHAGFQAGGDYYALRGIADSTSATADTAQAAIVFAETVATGESALIAYQGLHRIPASDNENVTVPDEHLDAITAFVAFRAAEELTHDESTALLGAGLVLPELQRTAQAAWERYTAVLDRLRRATPAPSGRVSWGDIGL